MTAIVGLRQVDQIGDQQPAIPPKCSNLLPLSSAFYPDQKAQLGARLGAKSDTLMERGGTYTDDAAHMVGMSNHADPTQQINDLLAQLGQALGEAVSRTDDEHLGRAS